MASSEVRLDWEDVLDLAAGLSGLARVRGRFLPFRAGPPRGGPAAAGGHDLYLRERTAALARAGFYNFLAATFGEPPSAEYLGGLREGGVAHLLLSKGVGGKELREWEERLTGEIDNELSSAFSQTFLRSGPRQVSLLASAYIAGGGPDEALAAAMSLSHGPVAEAVEAEYREAGLVVGGDGPVAPQHLAVELQFMHHCTAREAAAWGEGNSDRAATWRDRQWRFLAHHLSGWPARFADRLTQAEAHPFYRAIAELTVRFLTAELRGLEAERAAGRKAAAVEGDPRPH